jgi:hypothetical protein
MTLEICTQAVTQPSARRSGVLKIEAGREIEMRECLYWIFSNSQNLSLLICDGISERTLIPVQGEVSRLGSRSGSLDEPAAGESLRLKQLMADLTLNKTMLRVVFSKKAVTWHSGQHV